MEVVVIWFDVQDLMVTKNAFHPEKNRPTTFRRKVRVVKTKALLFVHPVPL